MRYGDGRAEIYEAWFEDEHGERAEALQTGRPCAFAARVRFSTEVENPLFGINLQNGHRDHLLSASNLWSEPRCGTFAAGDEVTFRIRFENVLAPDRYHVTPARRPPRRRLDRPPRADDLDRGHGHAQHRRAARPPLRASSSSAAPARQPREGDELVRFRSSSRAPATPTRCSTRPSSWPSSTTPRRPEPS